LTNQNSSMTFGGTGINFLQGLPQSQSIWGNINSTINTIKEKAFIRVQVSDLGKNNKQTAEIESANSSANDMLESKANLREQTYRDLAFMWKLYENDKSGTTKYSFKKTDIEVLVVSSTKWLQKQSEAAAQLMNQDGVPLSNRTKTTSPSTGDSMTGA
jgi:hypothetical protein